MGIMGPRTREMRDVIDGPGTHAACLVLVTPLPNFLFFLSIR